MPGDLPIVGGAPSDATDVMALRLRAACGEPAMFVCTAVVISPRALVTASHCVSDTPAGLFELVREVDAHDPDAQPIGVASIRFAPGDADVAVIATTVRLDPPHAMLGALPADPTGMNVTIVGYGSDGTDTGGARRAGTATISGFDGATITLVPSPSITCGGDSGGPVLLGDVVVAITSFGDPGCEISSTAARIDASRAFIDDAVVTANLLPENQPAAGEADCGDAGDGGCCSANASPEASIALAIALFVAACSKPSPAGPCGNGRRHGDPPPKGTEVWCTDARGTKHGPYTGWWPSGQKKVETGYREGRQHGAYASWHENGKPNEQGTLANGLRTGRWREHYDSGTLKREADHGEGGSELRWTLYREEDGKRWIEGGFRGQREHGHFIEWYGNGQKLAEGDFVDGQKTGAWSYWNPDGSASTVELGSYAAGAFGAEEGP